MIESSLYENYKIDFSMDYKTHDEAYYFIFNLNRNVYYPNDCLQLKTLSQVEEFNINFMLHIGKYKDRDIFVVNVDDASDCFMPIHHVYDINKDDYLMAARAVLVNDWYNNNKYCGRCGSENVVDKKDMMMLCPKCGQKHYAHISPAIIVAINNNGKLLMARHGCHNKGYTILAGFVECGESLEEAVRREVLEEVGIQIKNIKYQRSQSWPFPDSLMLGFTADYDHGEITVDNEEILDAKWFDKEDIQLFKSDISISHWLINNFIETH